MTTHLEYLRAIVTHTVIEPPPGKLLIGEEADRWARVFAFARVKPGGGRAGVRRDGVAAAIKLARSMAEENPQYHRGARYRTLAEAILNESMTKFAGRALESITAADLAALKTAVEEWFSQNVVARCYAVPCSIMPDISGFAHAKPFTIGPVVFRHLTDFVKARNLASPEKRTIDEMNYEGLFQTMKERQATWVAEVEIDGCEETKASEIANLAVDIALVGIQLVVPSYYSRNMARITGRTLPPSVGSVYRVGSQTYSGRHWHPPGQGLSGGIFDQILANEVEMIRSVGCRVDAYVRGGSKLPKLEQAWCDAAYWFHEGLAETIDSIAAAKLETAIEVLLGAESSAKSEKRLYEALHAFHGVNEDTPIATDPHTSIKQYVKRIVGPRSRFLHGTWSTLGENAEATRADAEVLSWGLLRLSSLALDRYSASKSPDDSATAFLRWINAEREASIRQP